MQDLFPCFAPVFVASCWYFWLNNTVCRGELRKRRSNMIRKTFVLVGLSILAIQLTLFMFIFIYTE